MSGLRLGTAKVDITPKQALPLAGFASRMNQPFDRVRHPLYARIICFSHRDNSGDTTALVISADLLWWGSDRVPELKRRIHERYGIAQEAIFLHGTHSHSGPQTSRQFSELLGRFDETYVNELESTVLDGIELALANTESVSISYGKGYCELGIHRRLMVDGNPVVRANPAEPCDYEVSVIRYASENGQTKALFVHYACHPTVTPVNEVSSEFCGVAMEIIEETLGGGVVAAYLQGACADVNPARDGELFFDGTDEDVRQLGGRLAKEVFAILQGPLHSLNSCPLAVTEAKPELPLQRIPQQKELEASVHEGWVKGEWSKAMLAQYDQLRPVLPLELIRIDLAEGFALVTMNCEPVTAYGLYIKALSNNCLILPVGYTNGMIGYVTTAKQIDEGGYESDWSTEYFFMPAKLDHAVEPMMRKAISDLIASG